VIITAGRRGEQLCWSETWTEFSARTAAAQARRSWWRQPKSMRLPCRRNASPGNPGRRSARMAPSRPTDLRYGLSRRLPSNSVSRSRYRRYEAQCFSVLEPHDHLHIKQIRMFPGTARRRSGAPGRPGVHSRVDRRSKAPRRAGADIARALPVGWPRLVTAGVCGVVLPGRLARAGQRCLRSAGDLCVAGYREEERPGVSGGPGGSARSGHRWPSRAGRRRCGGISGSG
jgi:hypothetical protein